MVCNSIWVSLMVQLVKNLPNQCRGIKRREFTSWVGKIPWRRKWQPTPVSLPGKFQGQGRLVGYSPWGCRIRHNLPSHMNLIYRQKNRKDKPLTTEIKIWINLTSWNCRPRTQWVWQHSSLLVCLRILFSSPFLWVPGAASYHTRYHINCPASR